MAERQALKFLGHLCERVRRFHAPGARVILCSDGRVFSDVVGMLEEHVTAYQVEISRMIEELGLSHLITTFNLDDLFGSLSFNEMRSELMSRHAQSLEALQEKVRRGGKPGSDRESDDAQRMYCGITRFLVEDAARPDQTMSKTAIQKDCKARAYEVIRRSNAWSGLVESQFPDSVRLSIHPQACGAAKLGIRLMEAESWMTPWHGVAVKVGGRFFLLKRSEAEALGATMVQSGSQPSHYELAERRSIARRLITRGPTESAEFVMSYSTKRLEPLGLLLEASHPTVDVHGLDTEELRALFKKENFLVLQGFKTSRRGRLRLVDRALRQDQHLAFRKGVSSSWSAIIRKTISSTITTCRCTGTACTARRFPNTRSSPA